MKKLAQLPILLSAVFIFVFSTVQALTNNFFIKDTFVKEGLSIKYSGVIKFCPSSTTNFNNDISFNLYLASFFIEEITYKGQKFNDHQLFGHTFPKEVLSQIKIKALINYKETGIEFVSTISSFDNTAYQLSENQISAIRKETTNVNIEFCKGFGLRLKLLETLDIDFPLAKELVAKLINDIGTNEAIKTKEENTNEYLRLLTEGNIRLNENNYNESFKSFNIAKKYTEDQTFINSKIEIIDSYLKKNIDSKYRWVNRGGSANPEQKSVNLTKPIDNDVNFESNTNQQKFTNLYNQASTLFTKNKYEEAFAKYTEAKEYTKNKSIVNKQLQIVEKYRGVKTIKTAKRTSKVALKSNEEYAKNDSTLKNTLDLVNETTSEKKINTSTYNKSSKGRSELLVGKDRIVPKVLTQKVQKNRVTKSLNTASTQINNAQANSIKSATKEVTLESNKESFDQVKVSEKVNKTNLENKAEVLKNEFAEETSARGFVKFKRDEQAVFDKLNRVLIPFGKYQIIRYRSGFANVKIKDSVALKSVECTGQNGEYSWSARVYQNPWIETVIDGNGEYVDELNKKVEIYVVDNVSLLPFDQVPQRIKDAYKDPNQFTGTDFVSAFKLWEKENADKPEIIARREEIKSFKKASKQEAYKGADRCKEKVSTVIEEVYTYYKNKGYEIMIKY